MDQIFLSLVQTDMYWEDEKRNLEKYDLLLEQIPEETEIVILPEMFATGFTMNIEAVTQPPGKMVLEWMQQKAAGLNKIIVGSVLTEQAGKYYNRMYWMRPDGSFDDYDKRHLFHMGGEHKIMTAGSKRTIVNYKGFKFLLQICYDLRFPVWSKNRYDKQNDSYEYDAIIYIANWPDSRKNAYLSLLKARAIENQAYVFWVNRIGKDGKGILHSGDSQSIDMQGNIIDSATGYKEQILNLSISDIALISYRNNFKVGLDWDNFTIE